MCLLSGSEPITDDETIYRRIPVSMNWYSENDLSPEAFAPRKDDETGLSMTRAKYKTIEQAGVGLGKRGYYVVAFRASDVRAAGIEIKPDRREDDPGHCELPQITIHNAEQDETLNLQMKLASLGKNHVHGPFVRPPA